MIYSNEKSLSVEIKITDRFLDDFQIRFCEFFWSLRDFIKIEVS